VARIGELGTTLAETTNRSTLILVTLIMKTIPSSENIVLTKATRRNVPEEGIPRHFICLFY
jgi:hypothetical protein